MDKFNLGLIGRCTALQPWIHPSELYHRRLRTLLKERDGIQLDVHIAGNSCLEPSERLHTLHQKSFLDGVLYHMRYLTPHAMFNSTRDSSGKLSYSLHPQFFNRSSYFFDEVPYFTARAVRKIQDAHTHPSIPNLERKFLGLSLRKINLLAGELTGLNAFLVENEWFFIDKLQKLCIELNLPLFILGPIPRTKITKAGEQYLTSFPSRKNIETKLSKRHIPHYIIHDLYNKMGVPIHKGNGTHLSPEGHAFLSQELYPLLLPWIQSRMSIMTSR